MFKHNSIPLISSQHDFLFHIVPQEEARSEVPVPALREPDVEARRRALADVVPPREPQAPREGVRRGDHVVEPRRKPVEVPDNRAELLDADLVVRLLAVPLLGEDRVERLPHLLAVARAEGALPLGGERRDDLGLEVLPGDLFLEAGARQKVGTPPVPGLGIGDGDLENDVVDGVHDLPEGGPVVGIACPALVDEIRYGERRPRRYLHTFPRIYIIFKIYNLI